MRKKMGVVTLILGIIVAISGCESSSNKVAENNTNNVTKDDEAVTNENVTNTEKIEGELKILNGASAYDYDTEEGKYYIKMEDDDEVLSTIRYIDYKARKEVYLCNKPNCKHNNKNCTAVLPEQSASVEYVVFGDEKYVYILTTPYDSDGSMSVETVGEGVEEGMISVSAGSTEPPKLYRMDKDGTNREKVFEFESGVIAEPVVVSDGNFLYVVTKKLDNETDGNATYTFSYDRKLVKVDLENGTSESVIELENERDIIGCSGRNLIVAGIDFGREVSAKELQDDNKYKELYEKSKYIISSINIDSENITQIKAIKNANDELHMEQMCNDNLYISYEKENYIEIVNLKSGEKRKLNVDDAYTIDTIVSVKGGADVIVGMLYSVMGQGDENGWSNYLINTETGKVTKSTLHTRHKTPIRIEAQNEEYLYVMNDHRNETEYVAWADVEQEYIAEEEHSILSKKDFLTNKGNYEEVELINGGE